MSGAIQAVPLAEATLCADCQMVTAAKNDHCLVCGSSALLNLSRILNGPPIKTLCAWCGKLIVDGPEGPVRHSLCDGCLRDEVGADALQLAREEQVVSPGFRPKPAVQLP